MQRKKKKKDRSTIYKDNVQTMQSVCNTSWKKSYYPHVRFATWQNPKFVSLRQK